jgi:hypothetical protein
MSSTVLPVAPTRKPRRLFTSDEDAKLVALVEQLGCDSWSEIARRLPGRSSRQCKERYLTYLGPNVRRVPWTESEDVLLIQKVREHAPRWSDISKFFDGRTANALKNRWHLHLRAQNGIWLSPEEHFTCRIQPVLQQPRTQQQSPPRQQFPSVLNIPFPGTLNNFF